MEAVFVAALVDASVVQAVMRYDVRALGKVGVEQRDACHPAFDTRAAVSWHPNPLPNAEPYADRHVHLLLY